MPDPSLGKYAFWCRVVVLPWVAKYDYEGLTEAGGSIAKLEALVVVKSFSSSVGQFGADKRHTNLIRPVQEQKLDKIFSKYSSYEFSVGCDRMMSAIYTQQLLISATSCRLEL